MGEEIKEYITLGLLGLMGFLALVGGFKGLRRGIKRQTVRTITIALSVLVSVLIVKFLYSTVFGFIEDMTAQEIAEFASSYGVDLGDEVQVYLNNLDPIVIEYILAIPLALLIGPIIFVPIFMVVSFILYIVHVIVSGILGFRKKGNSGVSRLLGMLLGMLQGAFVAIVLMVPVLGLCSTISGAVETIDSNPNKSEADIELIEMYEEDLADIIEAPAVKVMSSLGGNLMYKSLATIKVDGNRVKMVKQIDTVLVIYSEIGVLSDISLEEGKITVEQQQALKNIVDVIGDSNYFAPLLSGIVKVAASSLETELVADMEEPIKTIMTDVFAIFKTSNQDNIKGDLNTFLDFFFLFINEGVLETATGGEGDIMDVLFKKDANGVSVIDKAISILNSNERTKPLITSLTKISIAYAKEALSGSGEIPELEGADVDAIYESVKGGINGILQIDKTGKTDEEYKSEVSSVLEDVIVSNGFVEQSVIDENREEIEAVFAEVSDHIIENFGGQTEVDDAELISVLLSYYESFQNGDFE